MDYIQAQNILKNKAFLDDKPELISEAEKVIKAKETKTDITEREADAILKDEKYFIDQPERIEQAKEYRRMNAPGESWAKNYMPVKPGGGFDFNWRQYANTDKVDDIEKKRIAAMWDLTDKVDLRDVAVDMRFKNKNEKWEDFIKSDRFPEFKNFLKDVAKYQQNKELDAIWNDDSSFFVDFGLPIAKEYARKNYENIPTEDGLNLAGLNKMKAPLIADFATNAAMAGAGKVANKVGNTIAKDAIEYGAAPAIGAVSDALINDKPAVEIPANVFIGYGANKVTPNVLGAGFRWFNYGGSKTPKANAKKAVDEAVNKYNKNKEILQRDKNGGIWDYDNKKVYYPEGVKNAKQQYEVRAAAHDETKNFDVLPKNKMPTNKEVVDSDLPMYSNKPMESYIAGNISKEAPKLTKFKKLVSDLNPFNHGKSDKIDFKKYSDENIKNLEDAYEITKAALGTDFKDDPIVKKQLQDIEKNLSDIKMFKDLEKRFEKGELTSQDILEHPIQVKEILRYHNIKDKETLYNYLKRNEGGLTKSYFENIWGGSPQAQRQVERTLKAMVPQNLYDFNKKEEEKKKSLMEQIYGIR
jgi:hypothetical protein